jgi:hypothetical protein
MKKQALRITLICCVTVFVCGCQNLNSKFGNDRMKYSDAKEEPALKMPPQALALSSRYEIPEIHGNSDQIIDNLQPPGF